MTQPRLTIVIPTHDRPDLLPRAINSALQQIEPVQIILADDGDVDQTAKMLTKQFPDRGIIHLPTGATYAWPNWRDGAKAATTDFVSWLQDDDVIRPTYSGRITWAFDRFRDADLWLARLQISSDGRTGLSFMGNGPWVWMDLWDEVPSSWAEGSILASTAYFTSWSLAPAFAFRNGTRFQQILDAVPENCDIFVERILPAMVAAGRPFITDPQVIGYWIQHDYQLSHQQHKDQPAHTKIMVKHLDEMMDRYSAENMDKTMRGLPTWEESLAAWCQMIPTSYVLNWIQQTATTAKEGGPSRYTAKIERILAKSVRKRVKFGWGPRRWWQRATEWLKRRAAL